MSDDEFYDYEDLIDDEYSDSDDEEIRICTQCPARPAAVTSRLKAPNLLAKESIACLIFGDDALALVFWVPTGVSALHIIVADANRDIAVRVITATLPYERVGPEPGPGSINPALPMNERSDFANSVYLKTEHDYDNPSWIVVHPETSFGLNVADTTRSTSVDMFPEKTFDDKIRLPRPHAMVDAIIDTFLEHGKGIMSPEGYGQLTIWLASIITWGFRTGSTVSGEAQDAQSLLCDVKDENKVYFEAWIRRDASTANLEHYGKQRQAIWKQSTVVFPNCRCFTTSPVPNCY